jgi:predicted ester cyclase
MLASFPDFRFTVLDALAEDDRVVIRYRGQGTHRAAFLGMPPTGRRIDTTGLLPVKLEGRPIAEFWAARSARDFQAARRRTPRTRTFNHRVDGWASDGLCYFQPLS